MPTNHHLASKSCIPPRRSRKIGAATSVFLIVFLGTSSRLCGDSLKINGFWIHDLTIEIIDEGTVAYTTSSGDKGLVPLTNVQSLRLDLHPELVEALGAIEENRDQIAVEHLQIIKARARTAWLQQFIKWNLAVVSARSSLKVEAVGSYINLVRCQADDFLLGNTLPNGP